jgi:hypothetical protein
MTTLAFIDTSRPHCPTVTRPRLSMTSDACPFRSGLAVRPPR